jgi:hypothetical protein
MELDPGGRSRVVAIRGRPEATRWFQLSRLSLFPHPRAKLVYNSFLLPEPFGLLRLDIQISELRESSKAMLNRGASVLATIDATAKSQLQTYLVRFSVIEHPGRSTIANGCEFTL